MTENNSLVKSNPRFIIKKTGLAARVENAAISTTQNINELPNRIGLVFDDSGSMSGARIESAHQAIDVFVKNCNVADTALALYPLNAKTRALSTNYIDIAMYGMSIPASGGTPLYRRLLELIQNENITRAVAFSDGAPTDMNTVKEEVIAAYKEKKVPIDAIFIGDASDTEARSKMMELAERTGGIFLHFVGPETLAKSFKYLTPAYRAMLTSGAIDKKKVERGEI